MKRLGLILTIALSVTVCAVTVAVYHLVSLYYYERGQTMNRVRKCAENAFLLEMIGRMRSGEKANQSFIRLNSLIEDAQQKDGIVGRADTLRTSLASILLFGLEFQEDSMKPDLKAIDSIFRAELKRDGLSPKKAFIWPYGTSHSIPDHSLWRTVYRVTPASSVEYIVYVSPLRREVLAGLWGIIIPFIIVVLMFSFLSVYLTVTIRRMRTLEHMKDDFTHNMTHELKTPVAVAYSAADAMLRYYDGSDEKRNRQFLSIILRRLEYLSGMIENILSMSMERFRTLKLQIEEVDLKTLIEDVSEMIKLKADKPVSIGGEVAEASVVKADPVHLGNVLSNILDNAVKYSGESVAISVIADDRSITVADNGIGIDRKYLPYIFDKFYRVTDGDIYEVSGYGLGLFYVKQIVELHGWRIDVKSKRGEGTVFRINFKDNEKK